MFTVLIPRKLNPEYLAFRACTDAELVAAVIFQIICRIPEQNSEWVCLPVRRKKAGDIIQNLESMDVIESRTVSNTYWAEGRYTYKPPTVCYRLNKVYEPDDLVEYEIKNQKLIDSLIKLANKNRKKRLVV